MVWCDSIITLVYLFLGTNSTKILLSPRNSETVGWIFFNVCVARFSVFVDADGDNSLLG